MADDPSKFVGKSKNLICGYPVGLIEEFDRIAKQEHRTRSSLLREAGRQYVERFQFKNMVMADAVEKTKQEALTNAIQSVYATPEADTRGGDETNG